MNDYFHLKLIFIFFWGRELFKKQLCIHVFSKCLLHTWLRFCDLYGLQNILLCTKIIQEWVITGTWWSFLLLRLAVYIHLEKTSFIQLITAVLSEKKENLKVLFGSRQNKKGLTTFFHIFTKWKISARKFTQENYIKLPYILILYEVIKCIVF